MLGRHAGHIGTSIRANSRKDPWRHRFDAMDARQIAYARARIAASWHGRIDDVGRRHSENRAEGERRFREEAPTTAAAAATIILDGVKAERWRILVGADAGRIDELVRRSPERAYDVDFFESFATEIGWRLQR